MSKRNYQLDENLISDLTEIFKDIFGFGDSRSDFKREFKPVPLKKKGDIDYEVHWQTIDLEKNGHKVLHITQNRYGENVMIYRIMYGDGMDEEDIHLKVKIITKKGVKVPDSDVFLLVNPKNKHMRIADIKIFGNRVNRGYGSILMVAIMNLVNEMQIKFITGWISGVDWAHIDRSEYFYKKHGFTCEINHEIKRGTIKWINKEIGATLEELERLGNLEG